MRLQKEEDEKEKARLEYNNRGDNISSASSFTYYLSSEIHSDDSDSTTQKKLRVKQTEADMLLEESLKQAAEENKDQSNKRKFSEDDGMPGSSNSKKNKK